MHPYLIANGQYGFVTREIDQRFRQIERMLGGEKPHRMPQAIALKIDKTENMLSIIPAKIWSCSL